MTQHTNVQAVFARIPEAGNLGAPLGTSTSGPTRTWLEEFSSDSGRGVSTGFWRCDTGTSDWNFVESAEVIHLLKGKLRVTEEGGDPVELGPGDVASFPVGWKGTWEVVEPIEKFYVMF